jgi:hypothetical protein
MGLSDCSLLILHHQSTRIAHLPLKILSSYQEEMGGKSGSKAVYFEKLKTLLDEHKSIFLVGVDNVSSQQVGASYGPTRDIFLTLVDARDPTVAARQCCRLDGQEHNGAPCSQRLHPRFPRI